MSPQIIPAGMMNFNGYIVRHNIVQEADSTAIDLNVENHSSEVRILVQEDRQIVPPRLRLRYVEHPDHLKWSVQVGDVVWDRATSEGPPPFTHPEATLAQCYEAALRVWGYEITKYTREQLALIDDFTIVDLPLDGKAVFFQDYRWFYEPVQALTLPDITPNDEGDEESELDPDRSETKTSFDGEKSETGWDKKSRNGDDDDDEGKPDTGNGGFGGGGGDETRYEDTQYDEANRDFGAEYDTEPEGDNHQDNSNDSPGDKQHGADGFEDCPTLVDSSSSSGSSDSSDDPFYLERRYASVLMAPSGPKAQKNAASSNATTAHNSTPAPAAAEPKALKGPHPGHMQVSCQYTSEQRLRRMLRDNKSDPAREDSYRLQGVQLIDNVRNVLKVPVKTFDSACVYYHWFRLSFRDAEYNYQDAAMACLFLACKVEDTIKKSKEILCAAYNIKNPDHPTTQDDKMFEQPSKIVIGLERLILETVGFDFRCRYPQAALQKVTKKTMGDDAKEVFATAMEMSIDLYKTFAPIKQPTFAMALGLLELTARLLDKGVDKVEKIDLSRYHTTRQSVVETMLDLLDLYTQHLKSTKLGNRFDLNRFIEVKIIINNEVDNDAKLVRYAHWCNNCDGGEDENLSNGVSVLKNISFFGSNSAKRNGRNQDGTMRFVFDPNQARTERREVEPYFKDEYEEYEVEVEVPAEPERQNHDGGGAGGGHRNNNSKQRHDGWGGGGRRHNHHHDRRKGRGYY